MGVKDCHIVHIHNYHRPPTTVLSADGQLKTEMSFTCYVG
jgi:hypothetical protein